MNYKESAELFLKKRTGQKENIVITRGEAISALADFAEQECNKIITNPICPYCGKYKTMQGNGIIHQLCECGI